MARTIRQYRFYQSDDSRNYPTTVTPARLVSGSIFFQDSELGAITQLGIQALPGTKFYLNNSLTPVIIGFTGIYEIELDSGAEITGLKFDYNSINTINSINSAFLIVDAIYEVEE